MSDGLTKLGEAARRARAAISPWQFFSPTDVAGFAPGGGLVDAAKPYKQGLQKTAEATKAFREGRYGDAAKWYGSGVLDTGTAALSALPEGGALTKLAMAFAPAAGKIFNYADLGKIPDVPQFDLPRNVPARGVPQRVTDLTSDPNVREKMLEVITKGKDMGGANWYNAEPLRLEFVKALGDDQGNKQFRQYMDFVAATSPRSDVGTNVRNASYYYQRAVNGEGMPAVGDKNPQPYGHMAQRLHQMNAERVAGAGWDPLNNPKPASFVENLVGNQQPATIDTHAFRLPAILAGDQRFLETAFQVNKDAPKENIQALVKSGQMAMGDVRPAHWQSMPKANEYGAMEKYYQSLGQELGLTPAQTQASAWVGGGKLTGLASDESKPFLQFFEDRLNITAQKAGMDPKDVLVAFIKGKMPLLGLGAGTAATLGLAQQLLDEQQGQAGAPRPET